MLDDDFNRQRALLVRELAGRADPFIRDRLLALAMRYENKRARTKPPATSLLDTSTGTLRAEHPSSKLGNNGICPIAVLVLTASHAMLTE
jgi:hypothetical protein